MTPHCASKGGLAVIGACFLERPGADLRRGLAPTSRGVTLVELLVALAVVSLALSVVAALATAVVGAFEAEPAAADAHQRARSALAALIDDVQRAGSGFLTGADDAPGSALPPLLPDQLTTSAWVVTPTPGVMTTWHARRGAGPARLQAAVAAGEQVLRLVRPAYCPATSPGCGFVAGDDVVVYTTHGRMAAASVRQVRPPLDLELTAPVAEAWPAGSAVAAVTVHGYELRPDPSTGLSQIVRRLGDGPATPVIDFVTRFEIEWRIAGGVPTVFVEPGATEEFSTAGPAPPAPGVVDLAAWPAGENCAFSRSAGGAAMWRGPAGAAVAAPVPLARLADGPWCPDASAPSRWDLDLARVADVRVVLGVAVAASTLRPAVGLGLTRPPGARPVPDLVVETVVKPGRRGLGG